MKDITPSSPLTYEQINNLSEELRPGFEGEDEKGVYKIDPYGVKRRRFEKGGPSPNKKGRGAKNLSKFVDANEIIDSVCKEHKHIKDPLTTLMLIAHKDKATLDSMQINASDINFESQLKILIELSKNMFKKTLPKPPRGSGKASSNVDLPDEQDGFLDLPDNGSHI